MKKLLILLVVVMAVTVLVFGAFADGGHDQNWRNHHDQMWKAHDKDWAAHDRDWLQHRGDKKWREDHMKLWSDWYQWHRDNESLVNFKVSSRDPHGVLCLDIDYRK